MNELDSDGKRRGKGKNEVGFLRRLRQPAGLWQGRSIS